MDKVCTTCGEPVKRGPLCLACSCRAAWLRRHPDWTPLLCKMCATPITRRDRKRAVYCSQKCSNSDPERLARVGAARRNRVTKTCPGCNSDFEVPVGTAHRYTYCTRVCSNNARSRITGCLRCGGAFRHSQTENRSYCSETCRRPPVVIACEHCGADFRIQPQKSVTKRYCSVRCYRASDAETSIERRVREVLEHLRYIHRSQVQIGAWIVDFMVGDHLVIEADGTYWHSLRPDVDRRKTADIESRGYTVWRLDEQVINAPEFAADLERRLIDHEAASGQTGRVPPGEDFPLQDEHRVISGRPQRTAISKVNPGQLLLDV